MERYKKGEYRLDIASITPRGGPTTGGTQVTVRMAGISTFVDAYPKPKCKFGKNSMIVDATYIRCTKKPPTFFEKESKGHSPALDSTCI